jgi:dTDP-4-dehydrorhamnose 3,5-epimerase-like enzyme
MSLINIIKFESLGDERGLLVALEFNKSVPFDIKRVYYMCATEDGVSRGFHAHRNLKQIAVCLTGSCRFVLDNGKVKEEVILEGATNGLLIEDLVWREMHDFSSDCVLLVLASEHYDELDYIRDYDVFMQTVNNE